MKKIKITRGKKWFTGKVEIYFNYNLKWLLVPFILLWFLIQAIFQGLAWLVEKIIDGCVWLAKKIWVLLVVLFAWLAGLFSRKPKQQSAENKGNKKFNWWWLIIPLLLLLGFLIFRSCNADEQKEHDCVIIEEVYEDSWDDVVVARAYLDNVQGNATGNVPRALVGLKFIDGKPAKDFDFNGKTYEESVKIIADSWKPFVLDNVKVNLSKEQMTVVILTAMRMGEKRFKNSTFLKKVNEGDFEDAAEWFVLEDSKGQIIKTGDEPKQYFRVLQMMWNGEITANDLIDYPIWSYLKLDPNKEYSYEEMIDTMTSGTTMTPREALGLDL